VCILNKQKISCAEQVTFEDTNMEGKPLFGKNTTLFFREENDGHWLLLPRKHPEVKELIINRTSKQILDLCDGNRTVSEIQIEMRRIYTNVESDILEKDVRKIIAQYSRLTLIEWSGDNPFLLRLEEPLGNGYFAKVGQEDDLQTIHEFLKNKTVVSKSYSDQETNYLIYLNPIISATEYFELPLRQKLFNFSEEFFLLYDNERFVGVISIAMPPRKRMSAIVCTLITPEHVASNHLSYALSSLPFISVADITKVSIYDEDDKLIDMKLENLLYNENFCLEARIKNELGFGKDVRIFSHFFDKEKIQTVNQIKNIYPVGI
jgi:hypothetical protein